MRRRRRILGDWTRREKKGALLLVSGAGLGFVGVALSAIALVVIGFVLVGVGTWLIERG